MANPIRNAAVATTGATYDDDFCETRNRENFQAGFGGFWYRVHPAPSDKASGLGWIDLKSVVLSRNWVRAMLTSNRNPAPGNVEQIISDVLAAKAAYLDHVRQRAQDQKREQEKVELARNRQRDDAGSNPDAWRDDMEDTQP